MTEKWVGMKMMKKSKSSEKERRRIWKEVTSKRLSCVHQDDCCSFRKPSI